MARQILTALGLLALLGTPAQADPIDLTDPVWGAGDFQPSITIGNVTISTSLGTLWHDTVDGFGIRFGYEDDEVEGMEILMVSSLSSITGFGVSDFFTETRSDTYQEMGQYSLDNVSWIDILADLGNLPSPATNGEQWFDIAGTNTLFLRAPGIIGTQDHDFALQRLRVPEPATLVLLGLGLVVGFLGRSYVRR